VKNVEDWIGPFETHSITTIVNVETDTWSVPTAINKKSNVLPVKEKKK
jgi:hypothetical protein